MQILTFVLEPLSFGKIFHKKTIILIENEKILSESQELTEIFDRNISDMKKNFLILTNKIFT